MSYADTEALEIYVAVVCFTMYQQEAQLSQTDRVILRVTECFTK